MERGSDCDSASTPSSPETIETASLEGPAFIGREMAPLAALLSSGVREREPRIENCAISFEQLHALLNREPCDHLNLNSLRTIDRMAENKVDCLLRDEAVCNLRTLHRFYDRPQEELLHTVTLLDRFIARVKVKPKYIACVATACFIIAMEKQHTGSPQPIPSADALAEIVRFGGSGSDLDRMQDIICSKRLRLSPPIVLDYLRLFLDVQQVDLALLYTLEAALCSVAFYNHRPCAMALALCRVHRRLPEAQLCSLMQLCLVTPADMTSVESFLRKSEQRFREAGWRAPSSGLWPGAPIDRRRGRRSRKVASPCPPLYACPDHTVREEEAIATLIQEELAEGADASSFLLALTLDRSFPGVELVEHQQRPLVRILWRSRGQAWQPRSGENPFVFVLWNSLHERRSLASPEDARSQFHKALLTDQNIRERIDFPCHLPEEHRVFEFNPRTFSRATWEKRVRCAAAALGFEAPNMISLHALLTAVKVHQINQREIHFRNQTSCRPYELPFFKKISCKSVKSYRKICDRRSKPSSNAVSKSEGIKWHKQKLERDGILEALFKFGKEARGSNRSSSRSHCPVANDAVVSRCAFADFSQDGGCHFRQNSVGSTVEV